MFIVVGIRVVMLDLEFWTGGIALGLYMLAKPWKEAEFEPLVSVCAAVKWRRRRRAVGVHDMPVQ